MIVFLTQFFQWCAIVGVSIYTLWVVAYTLFPKPIYAMQKKLFPVSEETFTIVLYAFLGLYKTFFIIFILLPYISLLIIGS